MIDVFIAIGISVLFFVILIASFILLLPPVVYYGEPLVEAYFDYWRKKERNR